ncbi:MAG: T9SS type A sorting domain-containing protein, partial [Bacteroidota bacterium]
DINTFTCADEGVNTVTLTVEDQSQNSASCSATITVVVEELIAEGVANNCLSETHPVVGGQTVNDLTINGQLVAQVITSANDIDAVRVDLYKSGSSTETVGSAHFLSKRIGLTMLKNGNEVQPNTDPVIVRLYYSREEIDALLAADPTALENGLTVIKTSDDDCGGGYSGQDATGMNITLKTAGCTDDDRYLEFFTGTFSTFYLFSSDIALPVDLVDFTAAPMDKQRVRLEWTTQTESGNSHFKIERSTDGQTFTYLGAVAGAGDSNEEQWYDFVDAAAITGRNYYRLRQVDFDGTETLSEVRLVTMEGATPRSVYPNPATDELRIAGWAGGVIRILDGQGRLVVQQQLRKDEALSVKHLKPGFYVLQTPTETLRWLKQ